MNEQAKESITLPTIISFLVSVKNTVIGHQVKLLPFGKAFLGLHPPGNLGLLLLVATVCLTTGGCSTALITVGVLDKPEQEQMSWPWIGRGWRRSLKSPSLRGRASTVRLWII